MISSRHEGDLQLPASFNEIYGWIKQKRELSLEKENRKTPFSSRAALAKRPGKKEERAIIFLRGGQESARAYECYWGHYYNCNKTRIGMYCKALANAKVEEECRLKKIPDVKNPGDPPTNPNLSNQAIARSLPKCLNHQFTAKESITAPFRPDEVLDRIRKEVDKLRSVNLVLRRKLIAARHAPGLFLMTAK